MNKVCFLVLCSFAISSYIFSASVKEDKIVARLSKEEFKVFVDSIAQTYGLTHFNTTSLNDSVVVRQSSIDSLKLFFEKTVNFYIQVGLDKSRW